MFTSIIESGNLTIQTALLCIICALLLGFIIARVFMQTGNYSKNFVISIVLLPALVAIVVMMVNGNLGTGVAVVGAFSLVRFRSLPGSSREISTLFFSMAIGIATGMGYIGFAALTVAVIAAAMIIMYLLHFGEKKNQQQQLKITIPESLDYTEVFDDVLEQYASKSTLALVKTTNLGSMFELNYYICMKPESNAKKMIDEIRCRNGNLPVMLSHMIVEKEEL